MKIGEIWISDNEGYTIRLIDFYKKLIYVREELRPVDYVAYEVVKDPTRDVLDGDMPRAQLIDCYSKVYG